MYIYIDKYTYIHIYIYNAILKTICSPGYQHNRLLATFGLGHMMCPHIMFQITCVSIK